MEGRDWFVVFVYVCLIYAKGVVSSLLDKNLELCLFELDYVATVGMAARTCVAQANCTHNNLLKATMVTIYTNLY